MTSMTIEEKLQSYACSAGKRFKVVTATQAVGSHDLSDKWRKTCLTTGVAQRAVQLVGIHKI
ncbi:hypothetical protein D3C77_754910 [compost metagenome]